MGRVSVAMVTVHFLSGTVHLEQKENTLGQLSTQEEFWLHLLVHKMIKISTLKLNIGDIS